MSQNKQQIVIDPTGDLIRRMTCADSGRITLLRVCECTLRRASPIWRDKPHSMRIIDFRVIGMSTSSETISAMVQVLHMVHSNHQRVNLTPTLVDMHRILSIISNYSLFPIIIPYTGSWPDHCIRAFRNENHCAVSAVSMAQISWHLGLRVQFYEVMTALLFHTYIKDERRIAIPACLPFEKDDSLFWDAYSRKYKPMEDRPGDVELTFREWVLGTEPSSPAEMLKRRREGFIKCLLFFVNNEVEPRLANNQTCCIAGNKECDRQIFVNMWARINDVHGGLLPDPSRSGEVKESIAILVKELDHIFAYTLNNWHQHCSPHKGYVKYKAQLLQDLKDWRQCEVTKILEAHYRRTHFQKG
ncbi:hypothetical protein QBC37DRAFT_483676 [Rhypophila decipiens]|uniref:Uncharacterized protein n=1 Tax=Rhypophila decipiens TaxID=261697 RepID=A0AAN6YAW5_9PEZI|nr:hypothetical protein QBC37DRAFT_483676 [Rhypophila decipiens]